ncbi:PepSY-associated TM helix domain-containing protein [Algihabitans sp.]|uniref:PepSY-associated TM helix domain-containing protein n=1 Tax=Algihabitans sp. TaxID=2821514 RepID=UPI003BA868AA
MAVESLGQTDAGYRGAAARGRPKRKRTASNIAFLIHSASGLWLTILLAVVMISGTITVLYAEIDWLIHSEMRISPGEERVNPGVLYDNLLEAYPDVGVNSLNTAVMTDRKAASALVAVPDGGFRSVWINQFTGEVIGDTPFVTVGQFINILHTNLFLPVVGRYFVNFFGVLLLISIVTGLITYKKFWRGFLRRPRFHRDARTWLGDLHRLTALWSLWFLLIIGVTGTWWFYQDPLVSAAGVPDIIAERPTPPTITTAELNLLGPETPERRSGAEIVSAVQTAYPDMRVTLLLPPDAADQPFSVFGDRGEVLINGGANRIYVNPFTAEIMGAHLSEDWTAGQRVDAAMHPLHYGNWAKGGAADLTVKLVWFLGGAIISFLTVSGLIIYLKRTRHAAGTLLAGTKLAAAVRKGWNWIKPWGGPMGALKYVNILVVAGICAGGALVLSLGAEGLGDKGRQFETQTAGPFDIGAVAIAGLLEADLPPVRPGAHMDVYPKIADGRFRDARFIRVGLSDRDGEELDSAVVEGADGIGNGHVHLPETLEGVRLWIEIEGWDNQRHRAYWPLISDAGEASRQG